MLLDSLVEVVETLKVRISEYGPDLRQSEALTRYALIAPLLRGLGWDTANPSLVRPEYNIGGSKLPDYALLADGKAVVFLEAKRLGENLSNHRSQVTSYANELGIQYPALTNGDEWEVYDNSKLVPIDQRLILSVRITGAPVAVNALQFLLLWRPNLESERPVIASNPLFAPMPVEPVLEHQQSTPSSEPSPGEGWIPLSAVQTGGNLITGAAEGLKPSTIRLPDGGEIHTSNWWHIPKEVAEYLIRTGKLTPDQCPLGESGKAPIVTAQRRPDRNGNFGHLHELPKGCFLSKVNTGAGLVNNARFLLQHFGVDAGQVWLKLG